MSSNSLYLTLRDFIEDHSYLFGDAEYKVILALYKRMDYSLAKTFVPVSENELVRSTGKTRQRVYSILTTLERKGILTKLSGKMNKQLSLYCRSRFYNKKQYPLRSYNEKNIYDLKPLIILLYFLVELEKYIYDTVDFYEFLMNAIKRNDTLVLDRIFTELKERELDNYITLYENIKQQYEKQAVTIETIKEEFNFHLKACGYEVDSQDEADDESNEVPQIDPDSIEISEEELFRFILQQRLSTDDEDPEARAIEIMKDNGLLKKYYEGLLKYTKSKILIKKNKNEE